MDKFKNLIASERCMGIVNLLFLFSMIFRNGLMTIVSLSIWLAYLVLCINNTNSKSLKGVYLAFAVFATFLIAVGLYSYLI